jgi:hypothetical protein
MEFHFLIQAWQFNLTGKSGRAARKNHRSVERKSGRIGPNGALADNRSQSEQGGV